MTSTNQVGIAAETSVFILAAGRGERMRPLTDTTPKPLLKVGQHSLIGHHLLRLQQQGFQHIVINIAHLGQQLIDTLGDGSTFGLTIDYSDERDTGALETAGGIQHALPLLRSQQFMVINGDIWSDFHYLDLLNMPRRLANIVLVNNPLHNQNGDFSTHTINGDTLAQRPDTSPQERSAKTYTFSGIGLYEQRLFTKLEAGKHKLAPLLFTAAQQQQLGAKIFNGVWHDIGTPERLQQINNDVNHH